MDDPGNSPPSYTDLNDAVDLLRSGQRIPGEVVEMWMHSENAALNALAFRCIVEYKERCDLLPSAINREYIVRFLAKSIDDDVEDDFRYGRSDALRECSRLIELASREGDRELGHSIANMLAVRCSRGKGHFRSQVVDTVLEHVLHLPAAREFFATWLQDARLQRLYKEGQSLANKWQEL